IVGVECFGPQILDLAQLTISYIEKVAATGDQAEITLRISCPKPDIVERVDSWTCQTRDEGNLAGVAELVEIEWRQNTACVPLHPSKDNAGGSSGCPIPFAGDEAQIARGPGPQAFIV